MPLPSIPNPKTLILELGFVRPQDREDAIQEAWQAHLEGRDPARAVASFAQRLRRNRQRVVVNSDIMAVL